MIAIFLDDVRIPSDAFFYTKNRMYNTLDWVVVRSYDEFVDCITKNGISSDSMISFDHDLSDVHYDVDIIDFSYNSHKEKTGFHCAKWLVDYCIDNKIKFPNYFVHSMNPVGIDNIINYIENAKKHTGI